MKTKLAPLKHEQLVQRIRAGEQAKRVHARQWYINTAFFKGQQWPQEVVDQAGRSFQNVKRTHRPQPVTLNYMQPIILTLAAKLTQNRPVWDTRPATPELHDKRIARCAAFLLENEWDRLQMGEKNYESARDMLVTGQSIYGVYWDDEAGDLISVQDPMSGATLKTERIGAPIVDSISPFDFGMDPLAANPRDVRWCYRIRLATARWVKDNIDKRFRVTQDHMPAGLDEISHRLESAPVLTEAFDDVLRSEMVPIYELYDLEREHIHWLTRDGLLEQAPWDQGNPFVVARCIPNMGDIEGDNVGSNACWGETPVTQMIPIQRELNICATQIRDIINRIIQPPLLVPATARIDKDLLQSGRARLIEWSGLGMAPTPLNIGHYPAFLETREAHLISHLRESIAVNEITMGAAQGSNPSGRTVALQADQDAQRYGPYVRALEYQVTETGRRFLHMYHRYSRGVIKVRALGKSGSLDFEAFMGSELNTFDVRVVSSSMFAQNKALRVDQILNMWATGLERDARKIKRLLEFGTIEEMAGGADADRMRQRREIAALKKGVPIPVESFDVHELHLEEMEEWLKSEDWEAEAPEVKQASLAHYEEHKARIAEAEQAAQVGNSPQLGARMSATARGNQAGTNAAEEQNPGAAASR